MKLGEALFYEQPTKYIVDSEFYNDNYKTPVLTAGKSFILGYTNEKSGIYNNLPCIIFDDFTTDTKYVDFPFKVKSSAMKILTTNTDNDLRYLYHFMSTIKVDTELHKRYWISRFAELNVNIPSFPVQQQIAAELDTACDAIAKQKQQLKLCDNLIKSKFNEMFGDPVKNDMGWDLKLWEEVLTIKNGKNQKAVEDVNGQYVICGSGGVMSRANNYICKENSVIIGRKGNINSPILMKEKFWNVDTAFGLEANEEILHYYYLYYFCVFYNFLKHDKSVTIPSLTKMDLLKVQIPLPPLDLQQQFADFVNQVEQNKTKIKQALSETETLYKALMQKYFAEEEDK